MNKKIALWLSLLLICLVGLIASMYVANQYNLYGGIFMTVASAMGFIVSMEFSAQALAAYHLDKLKRNNNG